MEITCLQMPDIKLLIRKFFGIGLLITVFALTNPLMSLVDKEVYSIPMILIWRMVYAEPQHHF